jgi:hypothetical protein
VERLLDKWLLPTPETTATTTIVAGDTNFRHVDVDTWWSK